MMKGGPGKIGGELDGDSAATERRRGGNEALTREQCKPQNSQNERPRKENPV